MESALRQHHLLVLDAGLATELERQGCDLDDPLWSAKILIEAPEKARAAHQAFLEAGAEVISTATYQASFEGLHARGLTREESEEVFGTAIRLADKAREAFLSARPEAAPRPLVAVSLGSYGAYLADGSEYRGHFGVSEAVLEAFHSERLELLEAFRRDGEPRFDCVALETLPSVEELRVLGRLFECHPDLKFWASLSLDSEDRLADGAPLEEAAAALGAGSNLIALGVNCVPPERVSEALERLHRARPGLPLAAYPNSGEAYDPAARRWRSTGAQCAFDEASLERWYNAGARLVGGCCRTGPEDVRRIAGWAAAKRLNSLG